MLRIFPLVIRIKCDRTISINAGYCYDQVVCHPGPDPIVCHPGPDPIVCHPGPDLGSVTRQFVIPDLFRDL